MHAENREEGLLGLWKGVTPNIGRNAIINAAELASYDTVNVQELALYGMLCSKAGYLMHFVCNVTDGEIWYRSNQH